MSLPGAHCVISIINGVDPACMVHTHHAPCPRDGEPATVGAVHTDCVPTREKAVAMWRMRTHEQRTLVIHAGTLGDDHRIGPDDVDCPCGAEVIWARQYEPQRGGA